jgi:KipI family sensor histidine kinase inhibitor
MSISDYPKLVIASENSVIIYFSDKPCATTSSQITHVVTRLKNHHSDQLLDLVPSYASLLIIYKSLVTDYQQIEQQIHSALDSWQPQAQAQTARHIELPVYYSDESGPDLQRIADHNGLSIEQVITAHQQTEYIAYAIGFAPGFAYLGELDSRLATPRLATPRHRVPRGAVAIADRQTAVYPAPSPGGWNLLGLCPTALFNATQQPNSVIQVGDRVRFKAIDRHQFLALGGSQQDLVESP